MQGLHAERGTHQQGHEECDLRKHRHQVFRRISAMRCLTGKIDRPHDKEDHRKTLITEAMHKQYCIRNLVESFILT